jgi:MipA family protein
MRKPAFRYLPLLWLGACGAALAETPKDAEGGHEFLLGASLESTVGHIGDGQRSLSLKPVWHFQLGPFRVSRSRASTLLGTGRKSGETGVSADFFSRDDWSLSASLRMDNGRTFDDDPVWRGLPDIRTTVRGRVSVRRPFSERWGWSASIDQDLMGREGGMRLNSGVSYVYPLSERTQWNLGLSATWGNARYMQTQFGISPTGAAAVGASPYQLGGGWEGVQAGWNASTALNTNWVLFGGVGVSQLRGDAARSPLVSRKTTSSATMGVAYRNRR